MAPATNFETVTELFRLVSVTLQSRSPEPSRPLKLMGGRYLYVEGEYRDHDRRYGTNALRLHA
jgi:hypothetical protein